MTYYAELVQHDPPDSPSPGCGHYAGEVSGFDTATEALSAGITLIGQPVPADLFYPCCDFQRRETIIHGVVVYKEDEDGNRPEDWHIGARLKEDS